MDDKSRTTDIVEIFDAKRFYTDRPFIENNIGEKVIYPFGPPIFQTWISQEFSELLIKEGRRLEIETNDHNFHLAGNLKYGRSLYYSESFRKECEPYILSRVDSFLSMMSNRVYDVKNLKLDDLWINFYQKNDFNPTHVHNGLFSFIIYCDVPEEIFKIQADSNTQVAGKIIFEYGEKISADDARYRYVVTPFNNLMFIFNAGLRHNVPPYWADVERISVSGNVCY